MAKLGFGTYRITDTNQAHIDALTTAIKNGINFIDTATNFTDGAAHRAIAKVLPFADQNLQIVSKFGYIQGRILQRLGENKSLFDAISDSLIPLGKNRFYSIAPAFLEDQLQLTLEELQTKQLECFMINTPENILAYHLEQGVERSTCLSMLYDAIFDAFVTFEKVVQEGKIKGYGIYSNSFSLKKEEELYFDYEKLIEIAKEAAIKAGVQQHHFTMVELPINIAQKEGLFCSFWAKEVGLKVVASQPLSITYANKHIRAAQIDGNRDYYMYLNELLEFCDNELLEPLFNLINDLDERVHRFESIGEYDAFIHQEVLPAIEQVVVKLDDENKEKLLHLLELFLEAHREMVGYECGKKAKQTLQPVLKGCEEPLQLCAVKYLLEQESIDYVVVGARRVKYVYEFLSLAEKIN